MPTRTRFSAFFGLSILACAAQAAPSRPMTQDDVDRMMRLGSPQVLMIRACEGAPNLDVLSALADTGVKATVFVSGKALGDPGLKLLLRKRPDLFEVGNLGKECMDKQAIDSGAAKAAIANRPDTESSIKSVKGVLENMLLGSKMIEGQLGVKPKFYAFGKDFEHPLYNPYTQDELLAAGLRYLNNPTPESRFDILASSKSVFKGWIAFSSLDPGQPRLSNRPGGQTWSQASIAREIERSGAKASAKKASEAWDPSKRGWLAKELRNELRLKGQLSTTP